MEQGGGGWSRVEVDGAGWRWVHGLIIPLFESIKQKSKKSYFSKQVLQYKNNIKKTGCDLIKHELRAPSYKLKT